MPTKTPASEEQHYPRRICPLLSCLALTVVGTAIATMVPTTVAWAFPVTTRRCHAFASKAKPRWWTIKQQPKDRHALRNHRFLWSSSSSLHASTVAETEPKTSKSNGAVPITLLSGFLGSGKTTTLQHLLENKEGYRIGVVVNDMASVNIDAKLVKQSDSSDNRHRAADGVVELQNGCACCSLADELLTTVERLLASRSNEPESSSFDALVVELSGVGDPTAIRQNWKAATNAGHPVTKQATVERVVTLVDASTFGTDWMTWDVAADRDGWVSYGSSSELDPVQDEDCAAARKVPELLAEQIESADVLLLNKIDLADSKQLEVAEALARSINEKAILEKISFGKVTRPQQILREDAPDISNEENPKSCCSDPECDSHDATKSKSDEKCTDSDCGDPTCSEHGSESSDSCGSSAGDHAHDHAHDHSHSHSHATKTSTDDLGIVNFVYRANRPFETRNLMSLLNTWPVPIKEDLEGLEHFRPESAVDDPEPAGRESPFFGVLRSKGFCWLAPVAWESPQMGGDAWRHDTAMYWSHAGKHFGISAAGKWWATIPKDQLGTYFLNDPTELERILSEDFVTETWGDRRQELVFIGANIDKEKITQALDNCLVGDKGMERYIEQLNRYASLGDVPL